MARNQPMSFDSTSAIWNSVLLSEPDPRFTDPWKILFFFLILSDFNIIPGFLPTGTPFSHFSRFSRFAGNSVPNAKWNAHPDWLIAFTALLSTNEKMFAIEHQLLKCMLDGETPSTQIHESGSVWIFGIICSQKCKKSSTTWFRYFREWMLARKIKWVRLTETASVIFLTYGWIKWSKLSRKVDSQQHTPIEGEAKGYEDAITGSLWMHI